jgi:hypothetical protein
MTEEDVLALCLDYETAVRNSDRHADRDERSKRGSEYYLGIQTWTEAEKKLAAASGKPLLIFNEVLQQINNISSTQREAAKDIKVEKRKGGYEAVARLITAVCKHAMDMCDGTAEEATAFLNGVKAVRGWLKVEIDYEKDPVNGQVIIRSRPPLAVREDPTCLSYNLNDTKAGAGFVIDYDWVLLEKLQAMFPDKADELDGYIEGAGTGRGFWTSVKEIASRLSPVRIAPLPRKMMRFGPIRICFAAGAVGWRKRGGANTSITLLSPMCVITMYGSSIRRRRVTKRRSRRSSRCRLNFPGRTSSKRRFLCRCCMWPGGWAI